MAQSSKIQVNAGNPAPHESWNVIMKTVDALDEDLVKGYREDIDTLLVFAGLFSAVVTAFTVESYKWLEEDPADKTVALLTQITQQMGGLTPSLSSPQPFTPTASVVRINIFWFLSLTLALVDALFGLLCKQWVCEYQRKTIAQTPGQALALSWLHYQSFDHWHVTKILASLPILLEIALFLFLAGLLELLWARHHIPFLTTLSIVGLAAIFYIFTTILPGLSIIQQILQIYPCGSDKPEFTPSHIFHLLPINFICPYKSPQSWLIFRLFSTVYHLPGCKQLLHSFLVKYGHTRKYSSNSLESLDHFFTTSIINLSDWRSLDLDAIRRFSRIKYHPDLYELKGFQWLVLATRDIPSMVPHLYNVLAEIPPHLVMSSIFNKWTLPHGKPRWTAADVDFALKFSQPGDTGLFSNQLSSHELTLASQILCFRHLLATNYDDSWAQFKWERDELESVAEELWDHILKIHHGDNQFMLAFFYPEELLMGPWRDWRGKTLDFYRQKWDKLDMKYQVQLAARISTSINIFLESSDSDHDVGSTLLASGYAVDFFTQVNNTLSQANKAFEWPLDSGRWMDVLDCIRQIHDLPILYFKPILGHFPITSNELKNILDDPEVRFESVLGPLLECYRQCWDNVRPWDKERVVETLSNHINQVQLTPRSFDFASPTPSGGSQGLNLSTSAFVKSRHGLEFITFVNDKLVVNYEFHVWWRDYIVGPWVDALERFRVLRELPSGYFKRIPRHGEGAGNIDGYYTPGKKGDNIEVDGSQTVVGRGPQVNPTNHTEEDTGSPSPAGQEKAQENLDVSESGTSHQRNTGSLQETYENTPEQTTGMHNHHGQAAVTGGPGAENNA
ncbi:hypothetical protein E1B28_009489 [Marasmius oreades]|uniref:DUF6535 domain-containing protein n=1 Tax=Marasmius oreades TaxID=181124 RepID=A0A9P7RV56_9AGAR|nr:uncharacterized protein E1B28_009489 [Marasmius oreades]KAG7090369.1 hypothetical protein E1B28_009489 [Marasmius oreades]